MADNNVDLLRLDSPLTYLVYSTGCVPYGIHTKDQKQGTLLYLVSLDRPPTLLSSNQAVWGTSTT